MSLNMRAFDDRLSCYELSRQVMGYHVPLDNVRLELTPSRFYSASLSPFGSRRVRVGP